MIDIIFFAGIAVFVGLKLYNALGRKDFETGQAAAAPVNIKVVEASFVEMKPAENDRLVEVFGKKLADKILEVVKYEPGFSIDNFLTGAKKAFEVILKAFSKGDKEALRPLLHTDVYNSFASIIDDRSKKELVYETTLLAIISSTVKDVIFSKKYVRIVVQIISEQVNVVRDKQGKIVEGNPSQVDKISEIWTFGREIGAANPNWELLETAAAGA